MWALEGRAWGGGGGAEGLGRRGGLRIPTGWCTQQGPYECMGSKQLDLGSKYLVQPQPPPNPRPDMTPPY